MKLKFATFRITHGAKQYEVHFEHENVRITNLDLVVNYENKNGKWKPCVTHASDLIRLAFNEPVKSMFSKQRAKQTKPSLRVVGKKQVPE